MAEREAVKSGHWTRLTGRQSLHPYSSSAKWLRKQYLPHSFFLSHGCNELMQYQVLRIHLNARYEHSLTASVPVLVPWRGLSNIY